MEALILIGGIAAALLAKKKGIFGVGATPITITGEVCMVEYRNTSYYGNNSYWVIIKTTDGRYVRAYTASNSQLGYLIQSLKGRTVTFDATRTKNGGIKLNSYIGKYFSWEH